MEHSSRLVRAVFHMFARRSAHRPAKYVMKCFKDCLYRGRQSQKILANRMFVLQQLTLPLFSAIPAVAASVQCRAPVTLITHTVKCYAAWICHIEKECLNKHLAPNSLNELFGWKAGKMRSLRPETESLAGIWHTTTRKAALGQSRWLTAYF